MVCTKSCPLFISGDIRDAVLQRTLFPASASCRQGAVLPGPEEATGPDPRRDPGGRLRADIPGSGAQGRTA